MGDRILGCARAAYAKLTVEDLREIGDYDGSLLAYFRRELRRPPTADTYFGLRLEIHIAKTLIHHTILFGKSETPDFKLTALPSHGIECTSAHIDLRSTKEPGSVIRKIEYAINDKNSYNYSMKFTILAIDVSSLLFHEGQKECAKILHDKDKAIQALSKTVSNSRFQSVVYLYYDWDEVAGGNGVNLQSNYTRIDRDCIDSNTAKILDSIFHKGDVWKWGSFFMTT
jgi:hypothetical protein